MGLALPFPTSATPAGATLRPGSGFAETRPKVSFYAVPFAAFVLFAIGFLLGIPVHFVGDFLLGEPLLGLIGLAGILANLNNPYFFDKRFLTFAGLFFVSLCAYVGTDLIQNSDTHDAIRGWARFVFLLMDMAGIYVIGRKSMANFCLVFIGIAAGQALFLSLQPVEGSRGQILQGMAAYIFVWKFRIAGSVTEAAIAGIAFYARRRIAMYSVILLVGVAILSFPLDNRGMGIGCLAEAGLVMGRTVTFRRIEKLFPVLLTAALLAASFSAVFLLNLTRTQYGIRQTGSNVQRQAAAMTALDTIAEHPFTGIGSWRTDFEAANRHRAYVLGLGGRYDTESDLGQLGHSAMLETWVEGGPFAAMAFFFLFWRILVSLWRVLKSRPFDRFSPMLLVVLITSVSIVISPFNGGAARLNIGFAACICIYLAGERDRVRKQSRDLREPVFNSRTDSGA